LLAKPNQAVTFSEPSQVSPVRKGITTVQKAVIIMMQLLFFETNILNLKSYAKNIFQNSSSKLFRYRDNGYKIVFSF